MKYFHLITIVVIIFCSSMSVLPAAVHAQVAEDQPMMLKPVMIIRFNQPHVYFQKQLATIIRRAVQTKSDVIFDVVQYLPVGAIAGGRYADNLQSVMSAFEANGVNASHINAQQQASGDVVTDEVYIFVR